MLELADPQTTEQRPVRFRWHYVYFVLAGFDLLTVIVAVIINQQVANSYQESLHQHQEWVQTRELVARLTQSAVQANIAGNDVFDSVLVVEARIVSNDAFVHFTTDSGLLHESIQQMPTQIRQRVIQELNLAKAEMRLHQNRAQTVFVMMEHGNRDAAGTAMAKMDRSCGVILEHLSQVRRIIADQHLDLASLQLTQLNSMR